MLTFIGVGPGDAELITLKAVRLLRQANAIALPDSGSGESAVMRIIAQWIEGKPVCRLSMPMTGNRADWEAAHRQAADTLLSWLEKYQTVAYPVLGDPGIYATSSYLARLIQPRHPCAIVPGVPAMCAAAAEIGVPLCEQRESLTVTDRLEPGAPLPPGNAVIMKCAKTMPAIKEALGGRAAYAVRNLGMENEWKGRVEDFCEEDYSYFTTVIIKA